MEWSYGLWLLTSFDSTYAVFSSLLTLMRTLNLLCVYHATLQLFIPLGTYTSHIAVHLAVMNQQLHARICKRHLLLYSFWKNTLRSIPFLLNFDRSTFQLTQLYLVHTNLKLRLVAKVVKPSWSQQNVGVLVAKSACRTQLGAARCCLHSTAWKWMCLHTIPWYTRQMAICKGTTI